MCSKIHSVYQHCCTFPDMEEIPPFTPASVQIAFLKVSAWQTVTSMLPLARYKSSCARFITERMGLPIQMNVILMQKEYSNTAE